MTGGAVLVYSTFNLQYKNFTDIKLPLFLFILSAVNPLTYATACFFLCKPFNCKLR